MGLVAVVAAGRSVGVTGKAGTEAGWTAAAEAGAMAATAAGRVADAGADVSLGTSTDPTTRTAPAAPTQPSRLAHGLALVSRNVSDFAHVVGLALVNPHEAGALPD